MGLYKGKIIWCTPLGGGGEIREASSKEKKWKGLLEKNIFMEGVLGKKKFHFEHFLQPPPQIINGQPLM